MYLHTMDGEDTTWVRQASMASVEKQESVHAVKCADSCKSTERLTLLNKFRCALFPDTPEDQRRARLVERLGNTFTLDEDWHCGNFEIPGISSTRVYTLADVFVHTVKENKDGLITPALAVQRANELLSLGVTTADLFRALTCYLPMRRFSPLAGHLRSTFSALRERLESEHVRALHEKGCLRVEELCKLCSDASQEARPCMLYTLCGHAPFCESCYVLGGDRTNTCPYCSSPFVENMSKFGLGAGAQEGESKTAGKSAAYLRSLINQPEPEQRNEQHEHGDASHAAPVAKRVRLMAGWDLMRASTAAAGLQANN